MGRHALHRAECFVTQHRYRANLKPGRFQKQLELVLSVVTGLTALKSVKFEENEVRHFKGGGGGRRWGTNGLSLVSQSPSRWLVEVRERERERNKILSLPFTVLHKKEEEEGEYGRRRRFAGSRSTTPDRHYRRDEGKSVIALTRSPRNGKKEAASLPQQYIGINLLFFLKNITVIIFTFICFVYFIFVNSEWEGVQVSTTIGNVVPRGTS